MHWDKSPPAAAGRTRPYQGVRVRDSVKELLRRKRSLEHQSAKKTTSNVSTVAPPSQSSFLHGSFSSDVAAAPLTEPGQQGAAAAWKASSAGQQSAANLWTDYSQSDSGQTVAYPADVYMQTLCPSYTMLTYTHTPLITNFGTIPVASAQSSLPQMELPDSGLTYLPWAQPLTTISTMPNGGVQFGSGSAALSGSPLVHVPLSMSLTTMIPQLETPDVEPQILDLPQQAEQHPPLDEDPEVEPETPNLLDKLLEDRKEESEEEERNAIFMHNV